MPLPPLLMVSEPGSFAEHTIVVRKPKILDDVVARNAYPPGIVANLHALKSEMATATVAPLREDAPDVAFWQQAWEPWQGRTWRELGWFFAEAFFYRRLLQAVRYFQAGLWYHVDPFDPQKREELARALSTMANSCEASSLADPNDEQFALWLQRSLWGNRADLSNVVTMAHAHRQMPGSERAKLLIDHTEDTWTLLKTGQVRVLGFVTDNGGLELLYDLALIDWLLTHHLVREVHLHMKRQPYFVSDAMVKDLLMMIAALQSAPQDVLHSLGERIEQAITNGSLSYYDHPFWTTSLGFHAFPDDLRCQLGQANLLIFKGDVNYRRLLDDRHWDQVTDLAAITRYMPTSFLALRTLKGELIVGLEPEQAESLARVDPNWLLNGERGLVHLVQMHRA
jgi:hypothetical protein